MLQFIRYIREICNALLASGILKGYDALINLVLDNAVEYVRDPEDTQKVTEVSLFHFDLLHLFRCFQIK